MSLSHAELLRLLHYDPETGIWTRLTSDRANYESGDRAESQIGNGYLRVMVARKKYTAHRLAWFYMTGKWPFGHIDHANMIRDDNRWENLREATHAENNANRAPQANNQVGLKGVVKKQNGKFQAQIQSNRKCKYLGRFDCPAAAHFAYLIEANKCFGEFARAR